MKEDILIRVDQDSQRIDLNDISIGLRNHTQRIQNWRKEKSHQEQIRDEMEQITKMHGEGRNKQSQPVGEQALERKNERKR